MDSPLPASFIEGRVGQPLREGCINMSIIAIPIIANTELLLSAAVLSFLYVLFNLFNFEVGKVVVAIFQMRH